MTGDRSRYGTLEAAGVPASGGRSLRLIAGAAAVGLVALGCVAVALGGGAPSALLGRVAVPPGDFTAARDRAEYNAWYSELAATASKEKAVHAAVAWSVGRGEARQAPPRAHAKTTAASRDDLNDFFDSMPTRKRLAHSMSAATAQKQLDDIFPTQEKALRRREHAQDRHDSSLAMSAQSASDDLDSYFDSMETKSHKAVHVDKWNDQSDSTRSYIENKRSAMAKAGGHFTTIDADGKAHSVKDMFSSANARADLDDFFGGGQDKKLAAHAAEHAGKVAAEASHEHDKQLVKAHPEFNKVLDMAHAEWMKAHKTPPATKEEIKDYDEMVLEMSVEHQTDGNPETIVEQYVSQHPEVQAKFKQLNADWSKKHAHAPKTAAEKKEYADLMMRDVGKLNINKKEVEAKTAELKKQYIDKQKAKIDQQKAAVAKTAGGDPALEGYYAAHPQIKAAVDKVHSVWIKEHGNRPPKNADEQAEYDGLMEMYVGHNPAKLAPTTQLDMVRAA